MKKFSDIFSSYKQTTGKAARRVATTALFVVAAITTGFAQDFTFIEGSIHGFNVENHDGNTFAWSYYDDVFNSMPVGSIEYIEGEFDPNVTVRFSDMNRAIAQMTFLAVTETNTHGCSTTRAIKILIEPNNMYFDFASLPNADDCFNNDNNYFAEVKVGMNFNIGIRETAADSPIPESRFPLKVKYTVENKTVSPGTVIQGNGGEYVEINFNPTNAYTLEIAEAKGELGRTIEYELAITEVVDSEGAAITHDESRRVQIRIMNHLPQSGGMDMAMAYVLTPINYMGAR